MSSIARSLMAAVLAASWCGCSPASQRQAAPAVPISDPLADFVRPFDRRRVEAEARLIREVADFNNDGRPDVALSVSTSWGNAGGVWHVYFRREDGSYAAPRLAFWHPWAVRIVPVAGGETRIITYWHGSGQEGDIVAYDVAGCEISEAQATGIILRAGDGGDEADRRLYDVLFGSWPPVEHCRLKDFLRRRDCRWLKGYY